MTDGLVSIITTIYNSEAYIAKTIESVQAQSYSNWEMLITDDCSQDSGPQIVRTYAAADSRIKLLSLDKNSGPGVARNNSIINAEGRYIAFLDSDDIWMPDKLKRQLELMTEKNCGMVYSSYLTCNEDNIVTGMVKCRSHVKYWRMFCDNAVGFLTMMFDREKCGTLLLPEIRKRQDWALNMSLLKKCRIAYGYKDEPLAIYKIRSGSVSSGKLSLVKYNISIYHLVLGYSKFKSVIIFFFIFLPFYFGKKILNFFKTMFLPVRGMSIHKLDF
ncbi:MAG: glycosyltransferase [Bacteroidaceae bacterium]|nr:glycosyltransferase [Bacteroidaceae bacterium]